MDIPRDSCLGLGSLDSAFAVAVLVLAWARGQGDELLSAGVDSVVVYW
jgi:hypothetical protein